MTSKIEIRNLFLTRTALGVYITALSAISSVAIGMAQEFDATGKLTLSDWVIGVSTVVGILTGQGVVMSSRVGANGSLTYTPHVVWGPNRSDVISQANRISKQMPREETYVEPPLEEPVYRGTRPSISDCSDSYPAVMKERSAIAFGNDNDSREVLLRSQSMNRKAVAEGVSGQSFIAKPEAVIVEECDDQP